MSIKRAVVLKSNVILTGAAASAPTNLAAAAISGTRIDGTYTPSATAGVTHNLGYSSNGGASYTTVTVTGGTFSITGLTQLTAYFVRLRAETIFDDSAYAGPIVVTTPASPPSLWPGLDFTDPRDSMYIGVV